jgi:hypothetical protein
MSIPGRWVLDGPLQLLSAREEGQTDSWFVFNLLRIIRCIDVARCEYFGKRWSRRASPA